MCTIPLDTLIRANKRAIWQNKQGILKSSSYPSSKDGFEISISAMGKLCSQSIPVRKIKESFGKAVELCVKEI